MSGSKETPDRTGQACSQLPGTRPRRSSGVPLCLPALCLACFSVCSFARSVVRSHSSHSLFFSFSLFCHDMYSRRANAMHLKSTCHVPCRCCLALAGTLQTQPVLSPPPPPFSPILACHTFDLAAGGLRNPRSSGAAQPLAVFWCKARRLVVKSYCPSAYAVCPAPPRLASCFPWRHVLSQSICSMPAPSAVRQTSPHSPAQESLSQRGPRRANAAKSAATPES